MVKRLSWRQKVESRKKEWIAKDHFAFMNVQEVSRLSLTNFLHSRTLVTCASFQFPEVAGDFQRTTTQTAVMLVSSHLSPSLPSYCRSIHSLWPFWGFTLDNITVHNTSFHLAHLYLLHSSIYIIAEAMRQR